MDSNESPEAALARELHEELGIRVEPGHLVPLTFASHAYETFHLMMPLYVLRQWEGVPEGKEGQGIAWVAAGDLGSYDMPPADIPLVPHVLRAMAGAS